MNLRIATAQDLTDPRERRIFRFLEILPGATSWLTIILAIFLSWKEPFFIAVFILVYDIYWLIRAIYFYFHLRSGYQRMRNYQQTDWLAKLEEKKGWQEMYHLSIFTFCEEPWGIVKGTFQALVESDYPKEKMLVVLSAEGKYRSKTAATIDKIQQEFGQKFFRFLITWHPPGLEGEIPGKGSNDRWGQIQAKKEIIDKLGIPYEKVIVSFFDVDTYVFPKYFSCLAWHYLNSPNPARTSFQPIPLFINNIWEAPIFSRVFAFSSTFWNTLSQERPEKLITFSSHAMSFKTLVDLDFKQANIVSDDSRIFWQSFLKYDGDYRVQPLYYPVAMDANMAATFGRTMKNIYKQQRRWAYGVDEIPYVFFNFWKNKKISWQKKISYGLFLFESHWTWATSSVLIFLLGWLPSIIGGRAFSQTIIAYNLPYLTSRLMTLAMVGVVISIYLSFQLLPEKPKAVGRFKYLVFILEWLVLPLGMIVFWTLPAFDAQTRLMLGKYMGFWPTEKVRRNL
jgi:hypothetical protein